MKLAFDAKRIFKNRTGLGNYGRMITKALLNLRQDVEMFLCTPSSKGDYQNIFQEYNNAHIIEPRCKNRVFSTIWRLFNEGINCKSDIDIFHGLSQEIPLFIPKKVKKIVTIHDLIPWRYPHYFSLFDRIIYKNKVQFACKSADKIIAISQQTASDLIDILNVPSEKINVILQSCDDIFRKPISNQDVLDIRQKYSLPERFIVSVGTIERRKNQVSIVKAMKWLPEDVDIVFLGKKTDYAKEVIEQAQTLKVTSRIRIIDNAQFSDFPSIYSAAELSVYMSVFEGFGIPILESLMMGTPVVASGVSSMPEAGGDAALYAEANNPESIAFQCNKILGNNNFKEDFLPKAVAHCSKFSPDKIVLQIYNLYEKVANE